MLRAILFSKGARIDAAKSTGVAMRIGSKLTPGPVDCADDPLPRRWVDLLRVLEEREVAAKIVEDTKPAGNGAEKEKKATKLVERGNRS